jgi:VWFA-related protein
VYLVDGARPASRAGAPAPDASGASRADPRRVFILVFDQDHLTPSAFKRLRDAADTFLRKQFRDGDVGGVVTGGRMINDRLSPRREELLETVRRLKASPERNTRFFDLNDWPRFLSEVEAHRVERGDAEVLRQVVARAVADEGGGRFDVEGVVQQKAARLMTRVRTAANETLRTLDTLATLLGRLPGRKTVMFLTEGFFIEDGWTRLSQIVGRAAGSRVTIYTIDGRGLERSAPGRDVRSGALSETDMRPLATFDTWQDAPNSAAVDSGGFVVRNTNDFAAGFAEIATDTSTYYVLGYRPTAPPDGKFRRIEVTVRNPGFTVRARKGYVAEPAVAVSAPPAAAAHAPGAFNAADAPLVRTYLERFRVAHSALASVVDLLLVGSPREALSALERSETEAGAPDLLRGLAHFALREDEPAIVVLKRAVQESRTDPMPSFILGWVYATGGRDREAIGAFRNAAFVDPRLLAAHLALADAYLRLSESGLAVQALRAGLAALAESEELRKRLAALEKQ